MSLLHSNLNKTKVTVRTPGADIIYFITTADDARISLISNSCNFTDSSNFVPTQQDIYYLGTSSAGKDAYIAVDNDGSVDRLASFNKSSITLNTQAIISGSLNPVKSTSLGNFYHKWQNLYLQGCNLFFGDAILHYDCNNEELAFMNYRQEKSYVGYNIVKSSNTIYTSNMNTIFTYKQISPTSNILLTSNVLTLTPNVVVSNINNASNYVINIEEKYIPIIGKHLSLGNTLGARTIFETSAKGTFLIFYSSTGDLINKINFANFSSTYIPEHFSNLYFTDERAVSAIIDANALFLYRTSNTLYGILNTMVADLTKLSFNSISSNLEEISSNIDRLAYDSSSNLKNVLGHFENSYEKLREIAGIHLDSISETPTNKIIINGQYNSNLTVRNLFTNGDVIPAEDVKYDLGSSNLRWKHLYVSSNTIYLNNVKLSSIPSSAGLIVENHLVTSKVVLMDQVTNEYVHLQSINDQIDCMHTIHSTSEVAEGTSNLYFTTDRVDAIAYASNLSVYAYIEGLGNLMYSLTADQIIMSKNSEKSLIVNGTISSDLIVDGTLVVSNLEGITYTTYEEKQTERWKINNALTISGSNNLVELYKNDVKLMCVSANGFVGIGCDTDGGCVCPELFVNGNILFSSEINGIKTYELDCLKGVTSSVQDQINDLNEPIAEVWETEDADIYYKRGNVGIGVNPDAELHTMTAIFDNSIWCKSDILKDADTRTKTNISDIHSKDALSMIMALEPKLYSCKYGMEYGFLAQQVKTVVPQAVHIHIDIIPNIFSVAQCDGNRIVFTEPIDNSIMIGAKISVIDTLGATDLYTITDINDDEITVDREILGDKIFVYGTEVEDLHTLDRSYLYTLNIGATQELSKRTDELEKYINSLADTLGILWD